MIRATCGHETNDYDDLISFAMKDFSREGYPSVGYVTYCWSCYYTALEHDEVLTSEQAEQEWLDSERD